eukprot:gb/GECG01009695.1/.p1 GENE.gb/GECG01009695.1/~~gb/GECG01009695.1/.p1  ORF type:complete len:528 (+),score=67.62 gb/GECG01009695.1/:1-1584(+)
MASSSSSSSEVPATASSSSHISNEQNKQNHLEQSMVDETSGPWEWPSFALWLRQMEESMQCPICGRFVEAAVTIRQCGHLFCSECIRRHRANSEDQTCPSCRGGQETGIDIVATPAVNHMINSWLSTRQALLAIVNKGGSKDYFRQYASSAHRPQRAFNVTQEASSQPGASKYMKEPVYDMLKEKDLREKVRQCGLPNFGSQAECIRRHREFIVLFNAHIDSGKKPKSAEIAKKVLQREKEQRQKSSEVTEKRRGASSQKGKKSTSRKSKDKKPKEIEDGFLRLALEARQRLLQQGMKLPNALQTQKERKKRATTRSQHKSGNETITKKSHKPPIWRRVWSDKLGQFFYFNTETRMGQWKAPDSYDGDIPTQKEFCSQGVQTETKSDLENRVERDTAMNSHERGKESLHDDGSAVVTIDVDSTEDGNAPCHIQENNSKDSNETNGNLDANVSQNHQQGVNGGTGMKRNADYPEPWQCQACTLWHEGQSARSRVCTVCITPRPLTEQERRRHRKARRTATLPNWKGLG